MGSLEYYEYKIKVHIIFHKLCIYHYCVSDKQDYFIKYKKSKK